MSESRCRSVVIVDGVTVQCARKWHWEGFHTGKPPDDRSFIQWYFDYEDASWLDADGYPEPPSV